MSKWKSIKLEKPNYNQLYFVTNGERGFAVSEYDDYGRFMIRPANDSFSGESKPINFEVQYFMQIPSIPHIESDEYKKNFQMALKFTIIKENLEYLSDLINSNELTKANFKVGTLHSAIDIILDSLKA